MTERGFELLFIVALVVGAVLLYVKIIVYLGDAIVNALT